MVVLTRILNKNRKMETLTAKEKRVMELINMGFTNAEIASELSVSINTVKTHVSRVLRKNDVKTRIQLISNQLKNK